MTEATGVEVREEFRRRLIEHRAAILRTLAATDEEMARLDAGEPGGQREAATAEAANAVLSRLGGRERHELDEISDALARLQAGSYGFCERCGRGIALARLRAMPAARHCLDCQQREEASR